LKIETNIRSGFTLIEMILAIGIAAIVLVAVNAVFFTAVHLRDTATAAIDAATPIDLAVGTIRRDLQCVVTPKPGGLMSGDFKTGNVTSTGISAPVAAELYTATGSMSASEPWGEVQRVTYELKSSANGSQDLYRSISRNLLTTGTPDVEDQLLLSGVAEVHFSCYDGSQWQDTWDTTDTSGGSTNLPLAVRVRIQLGGAEKLNPNPIEMLVPIDSQARTNSNSTVGT
jgi:type II secretion system protein J